VKREGCGKVLVRGERCVKVWVKREVLLVWDEEGKAYKGLGEGSI
jgi:hypothetical protein